MMNEQDNNPYDLVTQLSNITKQRPEKIQALLEIIPADDYINLVASVKNEDSYTIKHIISKYPQPQDSDVDTAQDLKGDLVRVFKNKKTSWSQKANQAKVIIAKMSDDEWKNIWPAIDENMLIKLYSEVFDKPIKNVSEKIANQIQDWSKETKMEQVVYQGKIVEVKIPHGPENTIGILVNNKVRMVSQNQVEPLVEQVLGMTGMPSIARMLTLAGVNKDEDSVQAVQEAEPTSKPTSTVIIDYSPNNPMEDSRVALLGGAGSLPMKDLRAKISRESQQLAQDIANTLSDAHSDGNNYRHHVVNMRQLANSIKTMAAALDELEKLKLSDEEF